MRVMEGAQESSTGVRRGTPPTAGPVVRVHPTRRSNLTLGLGATPAGPQGQEELPRELLHAALRDAARLGYKRLEVAGGEPFLHAGLPGLLARARRLDLATTVTTNGMLLGQVRRWAPVAPLIDFLWITVDGTEAQHDAIRHREGAFAQTIRNLAAPRGSGVPFGFTFTFGPGNATGLPAVVRLAAEQGARHVQVAPLAAAGLDAERPDPATLASVVGEARRLGAELGIEVRTDAVAQDDLVLFRGRFVPQYPTRALSTLAPVLIVESTGTVRPLAPEVPDRLVVGNLFRRRLADMAPAWVASGAAAELAAACERTWWALADPRAPRESPWLAEVAGRLVAAEPAAAPLLAAA